VAGSTILASSGQLDFALARYESSGALDLGFDGDGLVVTELGGSTDIVSSVVVQPDGKIVVAGATDHDASEAALCQIMDEWTRRDAGFITRVFHLKGPADGPFGSGKNGAYFLNDHTVRDDGQEDVLTGNSGNDWFFFNKDGDGDRRKKDRVTDMSTFEALFAKDIDFIDGP
jgi:hypothetical protein